ncbi:MAG: alpha-1,2-fucosyltransferase [Candidatus Paracaedibacteraceae bacterium]|nr:alpha-1,2-fucosyltransferase [Candidatus Paracaedibacteraceae bacterium]
MILKFINKTNKKKIISVFCILLLIISSVFINKTVNFFRSTEITFESGAEDKISVFLIGRLGNQMFSYAAAYALSKMQHKNGVSIIPNETEYGLDIFNIPQIFTKQKTVSGFKRIFIKKDKSTYGHSENHFYYTDDLLKLDPHKKNTYIIGYYQSPLYFENFEEELREKIFVLKRELSNIAKEWEQKIISSPNSVSIHIRRGDYINAPMFQGPNMDYYKKSIALMQSILGNNITFFIFSDDYEYIKKEFNWLKNTYIVNSDPKFPYEDMFLMSKCQHNIIANSTYSWWGAFLNKNKNKKVIAPYQWFTRTYQIDVGDLYCKDWIILK